MPDPSTELRAGSLRLFVAIELPGEVREALSRLQHDLQRHGLEKLRWVRPEGIHLTLKFLGPMPAEKVGAIEEVLAGATDGIQVHRLALGRMGTFGGKRPRVLWLDLAGDLDPTRRLQEQVEAATETLGFPREARGWSPHVTLARIRPESARAIASAIERALSAVAVPQGEIPVRDVSLMRSTLKPSGAIYDRLAAFPLGGSRPGTSGHEGA